MDELAALVSQALAEDVGGGDLTTCATVAADAEGSALITQKAPGVIFGVDVVVRRIRNDEADGNRYYRRLR